MDGTGDHDCAFPNSTVGNYLPAPSSPFFFPRLVMGDWGFGKR